MDYQEMMDDMADVFCVGVQPLERWRPYVIIDDEGHLQPKNWTPQDENDRLIAKKEFHARCAYQYTLLADLAKQSNWEVYETLLAFRTLSLLEMRFMEVSLANFQIITACVGINNKTISKDELYIAAMTMHSTHLYLHDILAQTCKVKKNNNRKEVMQERPSLIDSNNRLARTICNELRAVHAYFNPAYTALRARNDAGEIGVEQELEKLVKRMQMVVRQLDKVLVVMTKAENADLKVKEI